MGNGMGLSQLVRRDRYFPIEKALRGLSHPVGLLLQLLLCLLFSGKTNTACSTAVQEAYFSPKLGRHVVLCVDYPPIDEASPVTEVEWKNCGKSSVIVKHKQNKSEIFGQYKQRTQYYHENNTLILESSSEEDEGIYEVTLLFQNNSVWTRALRLSLIMPPPHPIIKVDMNDSHATLELRCEVENGTNLSYHWLKSGQLLPQDERHFLVERNSTLQVNNLTRADCVNYTCVAANSLGSSEGHIQLNGSVNEMCSVRAAPALKLNSILSIATAAFCAFGMCVVILCFRRRQEIRQWLKGHNSHEQPANRRRGRRRITNEAEATEFHVYDEIGEEQISPAAQEVVQLMCVYTDFIPTCPNAGSRQRPVEIEDFGYSTIPSVEP
ncbi:uncharacterized protein LOC135263293 isoform X2 [Anguilla rostrata]|uniref:uncharacterized protein LOC135263293 isoform X2 n=1 Tax=Anguilla rostrata TaxID=7938 RepID=UPI0030CC7FCB